MNNLEKLNDKTVSGESGGLGVCFFKYIAQTCDSRRKLLKAIF